MPDQSYDEPEVARYTSLQDYLQVLRERWIQIAAVTVICGIAALVYSAVQPKSYEASARLSVRSQAQDAALAGNSLGPIANPQAQSAQLSALATRETIAERVAQALDTDRSASSLRSSVDIGIEVQTNLVVITGHDEDPQFAASLANEFATQVGEEATRVERDRIATVLAQVREQLKTAPEGGTGTGLAPQVLQSRFNELQTLAKIVQPVEVVTNASVPTSPVAPQPVRNTILGLLMGLLFGVVIAFARDATDTRLKTPREAESSFGIPRLGQFSENAFGVSWTNSNGKGGLSPVDLEAARIIRTNLEHLGTQRQLQSLAVTSSLPGEGKSTVAVALAWVAALSGRLTLLVECDLRQPVIATRLGLDPTPGLSDVLNGDARPRDALQVTDLAAQDANGGLTKGGKRASSPQPDSKLVCLTAGSPVPDPASMLASEEFVDVMKKVTKAYEVVIVDTSPLLSVVDTREILPLVDGLVLCARAYQTTREEARASREALVNIPVHVAGLVITGVTLRKDKYDSYYYHYPQSQTDFGEAERA